MVRKILITFVVMLLILSSAINVLAVDIDSNKTGSISVTLREQYQKTPIVGAKLKIYYVATVGVNKDGNLIYSYTDEFANVGISLDDPDLTTKMDAYLSENDKTYTIVTTDASGTATCSNLPLGLYFVCQAGTVEGYAPCTPFIVTVPIKSVGGYQYDVNASPKTEVAKLVTITIKKSWNTDESTKATDSVTVQLLRQGKVIKTAILNEKNNWQVSYKDMPESDSYSVEEIDVPKGFTATYKQNGWVFTVTNTSTLIQTGQLIWPIPVFAVSGVLLIWLGVSLIQKKVTANE